VARSTKAKHRKEFGAAAVERPLSSQFLDEFGPGPSSAHQTNTQLESRSEDPSNDSSRSNSDNDSDADMDSSSDSVNILIYNCAYCFLSHLFLVIRR
jgi:hypothetical protein